MDSFGDNRKEIKEMFLTILNGGFKDIYSDDNRINNYLKVLEKEITEIKDISIQKIKDTLKKILILKVRICLE